LRTLTKEEFKVFENIAKSTQSQLQKNLYGALKKYYNKVTYTKDYLIAHGDIPIALVAHMDTVRPKSPPTEIFYDREKNVMISPQLLGADDRAGVFSILKIIVDGYRPHIIFTTDEEIGCIGASILAGTPNPFEDLRYIIQLDRRGDNDCVFYDCDNPEFEKYVENFGFITNFGSFSDIYDLCPAWGVAGVNLSIGYRDEHTVSEVLFVGHMFNTIKKVEKMLSEKNIPFFQYIPLITRNYSWMHSSGLCPSEEDYYDDYYKSSIYEDDDFFCKCAKCGNAYDFNDMLPVKLIKGGVGYYCPACLDYADWCQNCGEIYEIDPQNNHGLCKECEKKVKK